MEKRFYECGKEYEVYIITFEMLKTDMFLTMGVQTYSISPTLEIFGDAILGSHSRCSQFPKTPGVQRSAKLCL